MDAHHHYVDNPGTWIWAGVENVENQKSRVKIHTFLFGLLVLHEIMCVLWRTNLHTSRKLWNTTVSGSMIASSGEVWRPQLQVHCTCKACRPLGGLEFCHTSTLNLKVIGGDNSATEMYHKFISTSTSNSCTHLFSPSLATKVYSYTCTVSANLMRTNLSVRVCSLCTAAGSQLHESNFDLKLFVFSERLFLARHPGSNAMTQSAGGSAIKLSNKK